MRNLIRCFDTRGLFFVLLSLVSECLVLIQTQLYCLCHYCQNMQCCFQICIWIKQKNCNTNTQQQAWKCKASKKKKKRREQTFHAFIRHVSSVCSTSLTAESSTAGWLRHARGGGFDMEALPCLGLRRILCLQAIGMNNQKEHVQSQSYILLISRSGTKCGLWLGGIVFFVCFYNMFICCWVKLWTCSFVCWSVD